ncbi:hypothetical protein [Sneathiella aquimaris]|jgi:hypothetical protein|uniref:hypothetical protein n=1 Tax=Sneathiella aquimaris TaxID=2599305 RepID=UPI00146B23EE|nr:hypothetical protein [Sneathiella aquimaris]
MPLDVSIALINTIEDQDLSFQSLQEDELIWMPPPPEILPPFQYKRCQCSGPSSGYEIGLKYGPLICRIRVTAWGIKYRESTPSTNALELIQVKEKPPYQLELFLL